MLDTSPIPRLDRRLPDRACRLKAVVDAGLDQESFKFVCAIVMLYTNVSADPIALRAARVYRRWCDARPDARM
jgi:hypothetical protein